MVGLDLCAARFFSSLLLKATDMVAGLANSATRLLKGLVGALLSILGRHDTLARRDDAGVHVANAVVVVAVAKGPAQQATPAVTPVRRAPEQRSGAGGAGGANPLV